MRLNDPKHMNDESNASEGSPSRFTDGSQAGQKRFQTRAKNRSGANRSDSLSEKNGASQFGGADLMPFADALGRHWNWLLISSVVMASAGLWGGISLWENSYTVSAQLLRQSSSHVQEVLGEHDLDANTYISLLRAPGLMQRVAAQATPPLPVESLAKSLKIGRAHV